MSVFISIDRHPLGTTKSGLQVNIENEHNGFRLYGPDYDGTSVNLVRFNLTEQEVNMIRVFLDETFPKT